LFQLKCGPGPSLRGGCGPEGSSFRQ
jgi:hypothetical protein